MANIKFTDSLADLSNINYYLEHLLQQRSQVMVYYLFSNSSQNLSLCNEKIRGGGGQGGEEWHGLIYRQLKGNTRWLEEAEADYLTVHYTKG